MKVVPEECPHSPWLTPKTCATCLHGAPTKRSSHFRTILRTTEARFCGTCPGECGDPIDIGAEIALVGTDDEHALWYHIPCAEAVLA